MPELVLHIITIFPEMFLSFTQQSILKKAQENGRIQISCVNPRDFTASKHKTCDDKPYGGGSGMILKPEPIFAAVESIRRADSRILLLSPQGEKFSQESALKYVANKHIILICGNYEGIDERVRIGLKAEEISIGDYILTNGTLAAAVVADAVCRLIPGVLGNSQSHHEESFTDGILEYPQYTRPRSYRDMEVPEVLLSGDHSKIHAWRRDQALKRTEIKRPDLIKDKDNEK